MNLGVEGLEKEGGVGKEGRGGGGKRRLIGVSPRGPTAEGEGGTKHQDYSLHTQSSLHRPRGPTSQSILAPLLSVVQTAHFIYVSRQGPG